MAKEELSAEKVIERLEYEADETKQKLLIFRLQERLNDESFAEAFVEADGIGVLCDLMNTVKGNTLGHLIADVRSAVMAPGGIDYVRETPDIVSRIYRIVAGKQPPSIPVAKSCLELIIVVVSVLDEGHKLVNDAAKGKHEKSAKGKEDQPYMNLIALLGSADLHVVERTLMLLNLLMRKRKAAGEKKAQKLLFRWKMGGLVKFMTALNDSQYGPIKKQLEIFQATSNITIPGSWFEAQTWKDKFADVKKKYEDAQEQLFMLMQQQPRIQLLTLEVAKCHHTIAELAKLAGQSPAIHPHARHDSEAFVNSGTLEQAFGSVNEINAKNPGGRGGGRGGAGGGGRGGGKHGGGDWADSDDDAPPPPPPGLLDDDDEIGRAHV